MEVGALPRYGSCGLRKEMEVEKSGTRVKEREKEKVGTKKVIKPP